MANRAFLARKTGGRCQLPGDDRAGRARTAYDSLSPQWTERHGSGGSLQALVDSLRYDGWERVSRAYYLRNGASSASDLFTYDQQGNLQINGTWTFDLDRNRLTTASPCTDFTYDNAGNLTEKTCGGVTWTYTYDALDRLTNVANTAGLSAAYTYDAVGQRIAKSVNGTVTRFVWRRGHVIYEATGAFGLLRSYTWGFATDDLVAIHDHSSGADYYVVQDKLRTVRGLVNRTGTWQAAWRYKVYGQLLSSAGSVPFTLRFRWAGAQYDEETGFYFLRSRYYDPSLGRFVQEDKIGYAGGLNLYAYSGRPTEVRDPAGAAEVYDRQYIPPPPDTRSRLDEFSLGGGGWDAEDGYWFLPRRQLTAAEKAALGGLCAGGWCDRIIVVEDAFAGTRGISPGDNVIIVSNFADFAYHDSNGRLHVTEDLPLLAHEVYHVRYYSERRQLFGFVRAPMSLDAAGDHFLAWIRGRSPHDYELVDGKPFSAYTSEQQAQIIQDWYGGVESTKTCGVSPYQPGYDPGSAIFEKRGTTLGWWK